MRGVDGKQKPMPRVDWVTLLRGIAVDHQFEFVERPAMAGRIGAGTIREFDDGSRPSGRLGQVRDAHRAARIKVRVGNLNLNGIGHGRGLRTLERS